MDVTVVSPLQKTLIQKAAEEQGYAANHAFLRKMRQSGEDCQANGVKFLPLAVETFGGWHSQAIPVISKLGKQLARHIGGEESLVQKHLWERLGILLMKGNAALILSRCPDEVPGEVDGVADSQ